MLHHKQLFSLKMSDGGVSIKHRTIELKEPKENFCSKKFEKENNNCHAKIGEIILRCRNESKIFFLIIVYTKQVGDFFSYLFINQWNAMIQNHNCKEITLLVFLLSCL